MCVCVSVCACVCVHLLALGNLNNRCSLGFEQTIGLKFPRKRTPIALCRYRTFQFAAATAQRPPPLLVRSYCTVVAAAASAAAAAAASAATVATAQSRTEPLAPPWPGATHRRCYRTVDFIFCVLTKLSLFPTLTHPVKSFCNSF